MCIHQKPSTHDHNTLGESRHMSKACNAKPLFWFFHRPKYSDSVGMGSYCYFCQFNQNHQKLHNYHNTDIAYPLLSDISDHQAPIAVDG